jgi:hypothetical protein
MVGVVDVCDGQRVVASSGACVRIVGARVQATVEEGVGKRLVRAEHDRAAAPFVVGAAGLDALLELEDAGAAPDFSEVAEETEFLSLERHDAGLGLVVAIWVAALEHPAGAFDVLEVHGWAECDVAAGAVDEAFVDKEACGLAGGAAEDLEGAADALLIGGELAGDLCA